MERRDFWDPEPALTPQEERGRTAVLGILFGAIVAFPVFGITWYLAQAFVEWWAQMQRQRRHWRESQEPIALQAMPVAGARSGRSRN